MASKTLSATIIIGGLVGSSLKSAFGQTEKGVDQICGKVRQLTARQKELNHVIRQQEQLGRAGSALKVQYAQQEIAELDKQIARLKRIHTLEKQRDALSKKAGQAKSGMVGAVATAYAFARPTIGVIGAASDFETAMLGVAKQVDGARDSSGNLTQVYHDMAREIQKLGHEIPMATNEIASMVTAGARMGVARKDLIQFTKTSAMMAEAFELPAGELADNMGKIAGLYKIPIPAIGALADSINYLDDNAISKGGDIIEFMTRVGGTAGAVKITGAETAALGSTLLTLGERAQTASTATSAMIQKFAAADKGTAKFKSAVKEIGMSTAAIQKGMQTDATGTILKVLDSIAKLPKEKQLGILVDLVGLEHSDTLAKLVNGTAEFRRQLALANSEAAKGSMSKEFQARMQTVDAQFQLTKNRATEFAVSIGSALLPSLNDLLNTINPIITGVADFAKENPKLTKTIVFVTGAIVTLTATSKLAAWGWWSMQAGITAYKINLATLPASIGTVGTAMRALNAAFMTNPIGFIIGGLALAAGILMANWDVVGPFFKQLWEGVALIFKTYYDIIAGIVGAVLDMLKGMTESVTAAFGGESAGIDSETYSGFGRPSLPQPAMAVARGGQTVHDNSQTSITIVQQPGQDAKALAAEVAKQNANRAAVKARNSYADGPGL